MYMLSYILNYYLNLHKFSLFNRSFSLNFSIFVAVISLFSLLLMDVTFAQNQVDNKIQYHQPLSDKSKPIIKVGSLPVGIDIDTISGKIYVANQFSNIISIIDPKKADVIGNIEVENSPYGIDVNPLTNRVYVTNRVSDTVSIIDGFTNKQLSTVNVGDSPLNLAVNIATNLLYVTNINSQTVSVIDTIENKVINTLNYTSVPYDVAVNPYTNLIYVSDLGTNNIQVIDGNNNTLIMSIPVDLRPSVISINTLSNLIYVSNFISDTVSVINGTTNEVVKEIRVGENPVGIAINPITDKLYVYNSEDSTVSVINSTTNEVIKEISVKSSIITTGINDPDIGVTSFVTFPFIANDISIDLSTNFVYITNTNSNGVLVIDGNVDELVTYIFVNINPPDSGEIVCSNNLLKSGESLIIAPVNKYIECKASANRGFVFSTWSIENSTDKNPLIFNVTGIGGLTANFKQTILTETLIILISVFIGIVSTIGGWLYRQRSSRITKRYLREMDYIYEVLSENNKKECITQLDKLQKEVNSIHRGGKINESQLEFLERKIAWYINRLMQQLK
ncbi:MAG: hypothetical protein DA328_07210 [Nitrososphaeraceae archaeon]|nr:hypothetical protein [Nitrososphaeraceae archaeon]